MPWLLTIAFFLVMCSIVASCAYWIKTRDLLTPAPVASAPSSGSATSGTDSEPAASFEELPPWLQMLCETGKSLSPGEGERRRLRRLLIAAGFRQDWALLAYRGSQVVLAPAAAVLAMLAGAGLGWDAVTVVLLSMAASYAGFRLPTILLNKRIRSRRAKLHRGLPDLLDLLVISIESGLSLDSAIATTAEDLAIVHPTISDELFVFEYELRVGTSRADALRNLSGRTNEPEMRKLTSLLIQADRFGTSIVKVLRAQGRYLRIRRRQSAEEMAHKVGVKLIFPIFFLIMPSIFLVTAGPVVIKLLTEMRSYAS